MEIKYIVKLELRSPSLFLMRDVKTFNGQIVPFAFRDCEQMGWKIAKFDKKKRLLPLVKKQEKMMAQIICQ